MNGWRGARDINKEDKLREGRGDAVGKMDVVDGEGSGEIRWTEREREPNGETARGLGSRQ